MLVLVSWEADDLKGRSVQELVVWTIANSYPIMGYPSGLNQNREVSNGQEVWYCN